MTSLVIQLHRYIGIPMSIIVVIWFASGVVMMYTRGMPALSAEQSLEMKSTIPLRQVRYSPGDALGRQGIDPAPQRLSIEALQLRPAYRFDGGLTIFADNGEIFAGADESNGREIVAIAFGIPSTRVSFAGELTSPDQWTITERRHLPLLKFDIDDAEATQAYVSVATGEVVLATDSSSRFLAWIGAIPHWIYFTNLRTNQPAWYWTVVILSTIGCFIAILGLILAFTQFRRSKPFNLAESIRYRGLMRWHYLTGAIFGVLTLTWLFSGLLSMDPFDWNNETGLLVDETELNGGSPDIVAVELDDLSAIPAAASLRRIDITQVLGETRYIGHHAGGSVPRIIETASDRDGKEAADLAFLKRRLELVSGRRVSEFEFLEDYDAYYYDREHVRPLPVVRAVMDDPDETWLYIDPATGRIEVRTHRLARLDRWLFNGLHSLDFGSWYDKRPLWDVAVIVLSLGGLASSGIGLVLGIRRMRRWLVRPRVSSGPPSL